VRVCITNDGEVIDAARLARRLGALPPDVDFVNYVVNTMAFAWLDARELGFQVRLQPTKIAPQTEAALYFILLERRPERVLVSLSLGEACNHKMYASGAEAVQGITSAIAAERQKRSRRFRSRSADFSALRGFPSLQRLLDLYQSSNARLDPVRLEALLSPMLESRFLLAERIQRDDVLLITAVGNGYRAFDNRWFIRSAGLRLEEQPDVDYGIWLAKGYRAVLDGKAPQTEEVDAVIYRPRRGRRRFTYRRLMLPFSGAGGRQFLLSTSMPDPSIDLSVHQSVEAC
jgi:hypothetical protein